VAASVAAPTAPVTNWRRLKLAAVSESVVSHPHAQPRIDKRDLALRALCFTLFLPGRSVSGLLDRPNSVTV
jgi:hypothetical protein